MSTIHDSVSKSDLDWLIETFYQSGKSVDRNVRVWCLWEFVRREGKGRGQYPQCATPSPATRPGWQPSSALLWSGDTKQTELSHTHSKLLLFPLKTLILPGERAALSDYREVMEQNIFKVVFPQLAWDDVMGPAVRTGEENSELHTKITYLSTDLTPIQFSSGGCCSVQWK